MDCSFAVLTCAASSGESAAGEDDEFADDDAHPPASELTTVPKPETTDASGMEAFPTSSGRPSHHEDAHPHGKQRNTKDLKATGVARAAARLLEQDVAEGGLAILSVRCRSACHSRHFPAPNYAV